MIFLSAKEVFQYISLLILIIIDRMMPSGDGIELIQIIKKNNNIPIHNA